MLLSACSTPRAVVRTFEKGKNLTPSNRNGIFIISRDSLPINDSLLLGTIATKHNGLTGKCNFRQVKQFAENEAKKIGGNVLVITQHSYPDMLINPCHRLKGKIYAVPFPKKYEKEILWSENRKLEIVDFKGSKINRPFVAATSSYFGYTTTFIRKSDTFKFEVDTYFDCQASYFKTSQNDNFNLSHEQLHFDITELYARKFVQRVASEITNFQDFRLKAEKIGDEMTRQLQVEQDAYDTEVYSNLERQQIWDEKIQNELNDLSMYQKKSISKPFGHTRNK